MLVLAEVSRKARVPPRRHLTAPPTARKLKILRH